MSSSGSFLPSASTSRLHAISLQQLTTPKQHISNLRTPITLSSIGIERNGKLLRNSISSIGNENINNELHIAPLPLLVDDSDIDSEEENNNYVEMSIERLNLKPKCINRNVSRSLPVTPRVNGVTSPHSGCGMSTPLMVAPHLATHFMLDGSLSSTGSLSPNASQYVTCSSGLISDSPDKPHNELPGIDYSSLPLPRDESSKISAKRHSISRHMSEPCIHQVNHSFKQKKEAKLFKCTSCPQRKSSIKNRRRDFQNNCQDDSIDSLNFKGSFDESEAVETQWKFIRTLVSELNKSRLQNNKIAVELHQARLELQRLKVNFETYSESECKPGTLADLVSQIHSAQSVRDEAMMARIKLANEERDAALNQAEVIMNKFGLTNTFPSCCNEEQYCPCQHSHSASQHSCSSNLLNDEFSKEEMNAINIAMKVQEALLEKNSTGENKPRRISNSDNYVENLRLKLIDSESSRSKLGERCGKLEGYINSLRRKVNGLGVIPNTGGRAASPSSFTFLDSTLYDDLNDKSSTSKKDESSSYNDQNIQCTSSKSKLKTSCPGSLTCSSGNNCSPSGSGAQSSSDERKDSYSSLDSADTMSVSSWKQVKCNSGYNEQANVHNAKNFISTEFLPNLGDLNVPSKKGADLSNHQSFIKAAKLAAIGAESRNVANNPISEGFSLTASNVSIWNDDSANILKDLTITGPITEL